VSNCGTEPEQTPCDAGTAAQEQRGDAMRAFMDIIVFLSDLLILLGTSVLLILLPVTVIQVLRTKRGQYLSAVLAVWAWALWLGAATAAKYPVVREAIGSSTLVVLQWVAMIIFLLLVIRVLHVVWNWPPITFRVTRRHP
jgi:hypothetical protein